jgi:hypothetical protein
VFLRKGFQLLHGFAVPVVGSSWAVNFKHKVGPPRSQNSLGKVQHPLGWLQTPQDTKAIRIILPAGGAEVIRL